MSFFSNHQLLSLLYHVLLHLYHMHHLRRNLCASREDSVLIQLILSNSSGPTDRIFKMAVHLFPNLCTHLMKIPVAPLHFFIKSKFTIARFTDACSLLYWFWGEFWMHNYAPDEMLPCTQVDDKLLSATT